MTETTLDTHDTPDLGDSVPAPTNIEEVSDYLARISTELNERKAAAEQATERFAEVEQRAQAEIDDLARRLFREVRELQQRVDAELTDAQARLTGDVESEGKQRDEAVARYTEAIDKVVASGLVARKLLASMGFAAPRAKAKPKPVVSKVKPKDVDA
ncbi:hypothetical protein [Mycolicibacterium fortuitum]|uniref:hypothetical protein n=1 Tax=Mycolicibacterium fortuitum TaxID=1766 RepID=UPI00105517F8|nr:hypothetical protein [Mycolicibacterium fortuitum]